MIKNLLHYLRRLWRPTRRHIRWFRSEHSVEIGLVTGLGLKFRLEEINGLSYLRVLVPDESAIGALRLVGQDADHYCVIHRSTKRPGWQVSFFEGEEPGTDEHHPSLQSALDSARNGGLRLHSSVGCRT